MVSVLTAVLVRVFVHVYCVSVLAAIPMSVLVAVPVGELTSFLVSVLSSVPGSVLSAVLLHANSTTIGVC